MSHMPTGYSLRTAHAEDFPAVRAFYDQLIDELIKRPHHPMWERGGHPADAYLSAAINAGELWLAESEGGIVGAMVVNSEANDGYKQVPWQIEATEEEVIIVHAFGVSCSHQGRGLGSAMMREIMQHARNAGKKALRLDLIDLNRPAEKIYLKLGFTRCAELNLYYEDVGWQLFHMFEYVL